MGFKGVSIFDPDYYTAQILSGILGSGMSSRLFQEIREKRGLVYTIFSHNYSRSDTGEFSIYAGTGEKGVNELMPVLCDEIVQITDKILPVEMKRSKARLLASLLIQQDNILEHAETNANSLLFLNRIRSKKEIKGAIESITTKQVKALAHRIFSTKPTFTAIGPIKNVMKYEEIIDRLQQDKKTPSVNV